MPTNLHATTVTPVATVGPSATAINNGATPSSTITTSTPPAGPSEQPTASNTDPGSGAATTPVPTLATATPASSTPPVANATADPKLPANISKLQITLTNVTIKATSLEVQSATIPDLLVLVQ
ncbi:hypothetical protein KDK_28520 [Dictyobacter kobayashii]|uniref:Uncharacterized protein n=1 Tax=Dictyobacter kobayashii TaxID=2014872 RepID=A0A402AIV0_9CHLR|nr:hypothetical protein KDK_28520 [Dictyobacter kobayashii]